MIDLIGTKEMSEISGIKTVNFLIKQLKKDGVPIMRVGHKNVRVKRSDFQYWLNTKLEKEIKNARK